MGNNESEAVSQFVQRVQFTDWERGKDINMKTRTFAITLIITAAVWLLSAPMLTGCGREQISDSNTSSVKNTNFNSSRETAENKSGSAYASMEEIKKAVVEVLGDNYWPDRQLTEEELETETGIKKDMYEDYRAEKLNVETDIDMMIILKAKSEQLSDIETMLNEYRDSLLVKYKDRPQELGKVTASRIEIIDSYICFVQLGADTAAAAQTGDEKVTELCQQENERAIDIIEKTILE